MSELLGIVERERERARREMREQERRSEDYRRVTLLQRNQASKASYYHAGRYVTLCRLARLLRQDDDGNR